mgnify:CR=1 FL=1
MPQDLKIKLMWLCKHDDLPEPSYATIGSSGMDVCACIDNEICLMPGERTVVPLGFALSIPQGFEVQVRPRSGLALRWGVTVLNAPGTIDADYRGEIKVILVNLGKEPFVIKRGQKIAQLVVAPVCRATIEVVGTLDETARASGGFGHTG